MKKQKQKKPAKKTGFLGFFQKRPLFGYLAVMMLLMIGIFALDQGTSLWKASLFETPERFNGSITPIEEVPNWVKTGGRNDRDFSDYASSELIDLPEYDGETLAKKCPKNDSATLNACITYPVVYMGNYQMDYQEGSGSHIAIDIRAPRGTPVRAIANGVVVDAIEKTTGFGKYVVIKHPSVPLENGDIDDLYSGYAHLSAIKTETGKAVKKGEIIGYVGDTGTATTAHLHFQIDRSSAPYHLWWPFSSAQASAVNLNFFDAINAGIGKSDGLKNTVNPLKWVAAFRNFAGEDNSPDDTEEDTTIEIADFEITANKNEITVGDPVDIEIFALDTKGDRITEYKDTPRFSSSDADIELPSLRFKNGIASIRLLTKNTGTIKLTVRDGRAIDTLSLSVVPEEGNDDIEKDPEIPPDNSDNTDSSEIEDAEDDTVSIPENPNPVETTAEEVVKFGIEHDGEFRVGQSEPISIFTLDSSGKITEKSFFGTASISFESGKGTLTKTKLSVKDFSKGEAKILLTPTKKDEIVLKIKSGVLVGTSKKLRYAEATEEIFEDVTANSPYALAIADLKNRGIINGNADGTFRPNSEINRAEFSKILLNALGIVPKSAFGKTFADVTRDAWFANFAETAAELGIIQGYPDGTFGADNPITRAELFTMLFRTAKQSSPSSSFFSDVGADAWFSDGANFAAKNDLLDFGETFNPSAKMTRGEVAESVSRFLAL